MTVTFGVSPFSQFNRAVGPYPYPYSVDAELVNFSPANGELITTDPGGRIQVALPSRPSQVLISHLGVYAHDAPLVSASGIDFRYTFAADVAGVEVRNATIGAVTNDAVGSLTGLIFPASTYIANVFPRSVIPNADPDSWKLFLGIGGGAPDPGCRIQVVGLQFSCYAAG